MEPSWGLHQDHEKCPFNRDDNYKELCEHFASPDQVKCLLNRGVSLIEVISVLLTPFSLGFFEFLNLRGQINFKKSHEV